MVDHPSLPFEKATGRRVIIAIYHVISHLLKTHMPLKREGISFSFFQLLLNCEIIRRFKKSIVIFHAKTIFIVTLVENQPQKIVAKSIVLKKDEN